MSTRIARPVLRFTVASVLALGAGACSTISDLDPTGLLSDDSAVVADSQFPDDGAQAPDTGTTPDLASLPSRPAPAPNAAAQQQQVAQAITAQGAQAQYSADALRAELALRITRRTPEEGVLETTIPGLNLYRRNAPTVCTSAEYVPRLIVFVQGRKRIELGAETYLVDGTSYLLTAIELPVNSQVIEATPERPILALMLTLDMAAVRQILNDEGAYPPGAPASACGMAAGTSTPELLDACRRLLDLLLCSLRRIFYARQRLV